jgi:hypothetical protein
MLSTMRHASRVAGLSLLFVGLFVAGRESAHGLGAFSEHWWCPIPLIVIVLGLLTLAAGRRTSIP